MSKIFVVAALLLQCVQANEFKYACKNSSAYYYGNKLITAFGQSSQKSCDTWFSDLSVSGFSTVMFGLQTPSCTGNVNPLPTAPDSYGNMAELLVNKLTTNTVVAQIKKAFAGVDYSENLQKS